MAKPENKQRWSDEYDPWEDSLSIQCKKILYQEVADKQEELKLLSDIIATVKFRIAEGEDLPNPLKFIPESCRTMQNVPRPYISVWLNKIIVVLAERQSGIITGD